VRPLRSHHQADHGGNDELRDRPFCRNASLPVAEATRVLKDISLGKSAPPGYCKKSDYPEM
jgi:hypothetical protein